MSESELQTATMPWSHPAIDIELQPGERYAGIVLEADGKVSHHLVLLAAVPEGRLTWQKAMDWASTSGGSLPTRQEQALLFANLKAQFEEVWYWSNETHKSEASYAWNCDFGNGDQYFNRKSIEALARAVRRI